MRGLLSIIFKNMVDVTKYKVRNVDLKYINYIIFQHPDMN